MTITELNKSISEAVDVNWFTTIKATFNFPHLKERVELEGLSSIYKYVSKQVTGWSSYEESLPAEFTNSKDYFENIQRSIKNFITTYKGHSGSNLDHAFNNVRRIISSGNTGIFTYNSPETKFLIKIYSTDTSLYSSAYNFITGSININSKDSFLGAMLAYEFTQKDVTEITKRRNAEKSSITQLRNDFENSLPEMNNQLVNHLKESSEKFNQYTTKIDEFKDQKEKLFGDWFINAKGEFESFQTDSNNKIKDLETTYEELLRLKKPADYWKQRATTLKSEGWKAIYILTALVVAACLTLYSLLWLTPEGMLASFLKGESSAIRWSVVYVTFISFLFFGIKTLNKIAFSSFHLARDAEEREQLTYVYLALVKEEGIDEKDKHLIMQSLFSRADTGLLKDDSSPTMPGDFAGKILNR